MGTKAMGTTTVRRPVNSRVHLWCGFFEKRKRLGALECLCLTVCKTSQNWKIQIGSTNVCIYGAKRLLKMDFASFKRYIERLGEAGVIQKKIDDCDIRT